MSRRCPARNSKQVGIAPGLGDVAHSKCRLKNKRTRLIQMLIEKRQGNIAKPTVSCRFLSNANLNKNGFTKN